MGRRTVEEDELLAAERLQQVCMHFAASNGSSSSDGGKANPVQMHDAAT